MTSFAEQKKPKIKAVIKTDTKREPQTILTHFWLMLSFYTLLKILENQMFSGVFRGYKMGTLARNGLTLIQHQNV